MLCVVFWQSFRPHLINEVNHMLRFAHFNFNVLDLDKSLAFYRDALELSPVRTDRKSVV